MNYLAMFERLLELTRSDSDEQVGLTEKESAEMEALKAFFKGYLEAITPGLSGKD